ncbi:hypothetical protein CR513_30708, partial [Mucuna pruriens]
MPPHGGPSVNTLSHEPIGQETLEQGMSQIVTPFLKPLTIYYDPIQMPHTPLTINVPAQPTYRDNHAVPWRYDLVIVAASEVPGEKSLVKEITNIVEARGVTRSGRIYTLEILRRRETLTPTTENTSTRNTQALGPGREVEEFLKIICHSEY